MTRIGTCPYCRRRVPLTPDGRIGEHKRGNSERDNWCQDGSYGWKPMEES